VGYSASSIEVGFSFLQCIRHVECPKLVKITSALWFTPMLVKSYIGVTRTQFSLHLPFSMAIQRVMKLSLS